MILDRRIPFRYIFGKVRYDLLNIIVIGLVVHYLTTYFRAYLPEMPISIVAFLGTSISVLLSFKLNQSYDRWWEARKVWGAIVNDSRTLVMQAQSFIHRDADAVQRIAYRQMAWCYSLGASLRNLDALAEARKILSQSDIEKIAPHNNKPLAILQLNSAELSALEKSGTMDVFSKVQLDNTLVRLCDAMGKAERINNTVFPSTYRLFLHLIIYLFVITLSIALRDVATYFELPLLVMISLCFLLLEKSAFYLQDPFRNRPSDVPVSAIARSIEINLRQLLNEKEIPEPASPHDFYIL